eukprot:EG_transcript_9013
MADWANGKGKGKGKGMGKGDGKGKGFGGGKGSRPGSRAASPARSQEDDWNTRPLNEDPNYQRPEVSEEELFKNTQNQFHFENITVDQNMSGTDSEKYVISKRFEEYNLDAVLMGNIKRCGYKFTTPAQQLAIPVLLDSRDLVLAAQTGSGKTVAFLIPMIQGILTQRQLRHGVPLGVVLSPTRELCTQIYDDARKLMANTGLDVCYAYGGTRTTLQAEKILKGCDILVSTPGRLKDFLDKGVVDLSQTKWAVLDECDEMLSRGFKEDMYDIFDRMPPKEERTTGFFSATFAPELRQVAGDFLQAEDSNTRYGYIFARVAPVLIVPHGIVQTIEDVGSHNHKGMMESLCWYIDNAPDALFLVFVKTKVEAITIEGELYQRGYAVAALHGDKSQQAREYALGQFKSRNIKVLVATDVASRGLDICKCDYVVNVGMPQDVDTYIHRIGRTGRCGLEGNAVTLFDGTNMHTVPGILQVFEKNEQTIPDWFAQLADRCANLPPVGKGKGGKAGKGGGGGGFGGGGFGGGGKGKGDGKGKGKGKGKG